MRFPLGFILMTLLLTSCAGKNNKKINSDTGLTESEFQQVQLINDSVADVARAMQLAFESRVMDRPSEKATQLSKMIDPGDCTYVPMRPPSNKYDHTWAGTGSIVGSRCPVQFTDQIEYTNVENRRSFKIVERSFVATGENFQKESALVSYSIRNGSLEWTKSNGNMQQIKGQFEYNNFRVKGVGVVFATISTLQKYSGPRGQGQLSFKLQTRTQLRIHLDVRWTAGRTPIYRINGAEVDEIVVHELFSSFPLNELMEYSRGMRY